MNTNTLKKFAQEARKKLITQVAAKLEYVLQTDSTALREVQEQVKRLREEIAKTSKHQVIDKVAYTWFNRLMALRFMDVNDFQPLGIRIISPKEGFTTPEILEEAKRGQLPSDLPIKKERIFDLLDGKIPSTNPQNEVFKAVLISACNHLHQVLPFLFERINDYTDLLLPDDLTSEFSIVQDIRNGMSKEDCEEVEIIGWLYQFYISEWNEELIKSKKQYKKNELAPASQLFTPRWIVEYMVDNTLGQIWTEINPNSKLTDSLEFYIKPSYLDQLQPRNKKSVEEIKFFEPCVGSGHILSYAFDVFYKIYEEEGYNPVEIPELILTKNLFGVDIDPRAAQLASFVLIMKARRKSRSFFRTIERTKLQPNISHYQDFDFDQKFQSATAIGSLIKVDSKEVKDFRVEENSLFTERQKELKKLYSLLGQSYDVVVTNPPYIGSSRMEGELKTYVEQHYPETKSDLFATFILRCLELCNEDGLTGYMTPFVWMFISSYEKLRKKLIDGHFINNLIQLEYSGFDGATVPICTFTLRNKPISDANGSYIKLSDFKGSKNQAPKTLEAIQNPSCGWFYTANQKEFEKIPEYRFGYWMSQVQINSFLEHDELQNKYPPKAGLSTANNDRFLRFWWEVPLFKCDFNCKSREDLIHSKKWIPMTKGGKFRKWYGNNEYVLNFNNNGEELKYWLVNNPNDPSTKSWSRYIRNYNFYCQPGISFSDVSSGTPAFRYQEYGYIPNSRGPFIYKTNYCLLGFLNSKICVSFLSLLSPTLTFNVGDVAKVPYRDLNSDKILNLVETCVFVSKLDFHSSENTWDFSSHHLLKQDSQELSEILNLYEQYWKNKFLQIHRNEEELHRQFIEIYGLQEELTSEVSLEEITILQGELDRGTLKKETSRLPRDPETGLVSDYTGVQLSFDAQEVFSQFISYAVGCMFGRYSLDKEGLILANQGETLEDYLSIIASENVIANHEERSGKQSPSFLPDSDNIIPVLDDEWFEDDIAGRFKEFLKVTFGKENLEKNLAFVESCIGKDIRKYFVKDFYTDHIQRYKKRPIYWMFSSPKGSFNVLIYMHRYTPDTLSKILNDYLNQYREKLKGRMEHLDHLIVSGSSTEQTKAAKEKDKIRGVLMELQEYERDILYPLAFERIAIDLDDGVLVNYNKFGKAIKEVSGLNDKVAKKKVREFDWIDTSEIR